MKVIGFFVACCVVSLSCGSYSGGGPASSNIVVKEANFEIVPGKRVGTLELGDTVPEAKQKLGNRRFHEFDVGASNPNCPETSLEWGDPNENIENVRNGIRAFVKDGKVKQIKVDSLLYSTVEGATSGTPAGAVTANLPSAKSYILRKSSPDLNDGHDYHYLVDEERGIAFEFEYFSDLKESKTRYIYVFPPNTKFEPGGCVLFPQQWEPM